MEILLPRILASQEEYFFQESQNTVECIMSKEEEQGGRNDSPNNKRLLSPVPTGSITNSPKRSSQVVVRPDHPDWSRLNFPHRLHHMLTFMEEEGLSHIARWDANGECFVVKNSEKLVHKFFPLFFQHRKWKSFQRVRSSITEWKKFDL